MKNIVLILTLILSTNAFAETMNTYKMAKKLNFWTGIQVDMNVEKDDSCVYFQVKSLYKAAKGLRIAQRKNLKVYLDNHFNKLVIHPTEMVGEYTGDFGVVYLLDQFSKYDSYNGRKMDYNEVSRRTVFDEKNYEGEENKNTFENVEDDLNIFVTKADKRYTHKSFFVLRKKVNKRNGYKQFTTSSWSDKFRYATDEISAIESADMDKKTKMGKVECGKMLTWYDFGYDAQY